MIRLSDFQEMLVVEEDDVLGRSKVRKGKAEYLQQVSKDGKAQLTLPSHGRIIALFTGPLILRPAEHVRMEEYYISITLFFSMTHSTSNRVVNLYASTYLLLN